MKISIFIATSLDGYIARENGALDWLPGSDAENDTANAEEYGYKAFMDSIDALVMGRHTFETVRSFGEWPYGNKRVFVLSNTLTRLPDDVPDSVMLKSGAPTDIYGELKNSGLSYIYIDGGKTIQRFLDAGLVDEMIITTIPILIGSGIPLFGPAHRDIKLEHLETRSFNNGFVQNRYRASKRS